MKLQEIIPNTQCICPRSAATITPSASKRDFQKEEEAAKQNISVSVNGSAENELLPQ
jgi:hypothetical protein